MAQLIPDAWLPEAHGKLARVITHWTAGSSYPSEVDLEHYHFLLNGVGHVHRGDHSVLDNLSTADDDYAAHTRGLNTGSVGLALCGMAGANENPFAPGPYPLKKGQWNNALIAAADLCRRYKIKPDEKGLLMHCEVERVYGKPQNKWDISVLPFARGGWGGLTPGQEMRERVRALLEG